MKVESTSFTVADLEHYGDELVEHERKVLADRLERASARLAELGLTVGHEEVASSDNDTWSATEVLAHIAVLSKFYGMLTYKVGTGQITELDLLRNVNLRDHRRTVAYLRSADAAAMRRECVIDGGRTVMRAEDMARQALIAHLEVHIDQLERTLAG